MTEAAPPADMSDADLEREIARINAERHKTRSVRAFKPLGGGESSFQITDNFMVERLNSLRGELSRRQVVRSNLAKEAWDHSQQLQAARREVEKTQAESATFWFRRYFTSLGIANGAAFAALASGVLQADKPADIAPLAAPAMEHFAWGLLAAGAIPLLFYVEYKIRDFRNDRYDPNRFQAAVLPALQVIAGWSVYFAGTVGTYRFAMGLFTAIGAVHGLVRH